MPKDDVIEFEGTVVEDLLKICSLLITLLLSYNI